MKMWLLKVREALSLGSLRLLEGTENSDGKVVMVLGLRGTPHLPFALVAF